MIQKYTTQQPDTTDIFHRSKALLEEIIQQVGKRTVISSKAREVLSNVEYMYGQLALLEGQERNGVDLTDDPLDIIEGEDELW